MSHKPKCKASLPFAFSALPPAPRSCPSCAWGKAGSLIDDGDNHFQISFLSLGEETVYSLI